MSTTLPGKIIQISTTSSEFGGDCVYMLDDKGHIFRRRATQRAEESSVLFY